MNALEAKQPQLQRGRLKEDPDNVIKAIKAPAKKRQRLLADKTTRGNQAYPNFLLNSDIASEIFSFLDIRSLYNVTATSKVGMKLLRHEHVVRSAMMQGGHSKTSMERLIPLIEKRCIWIPSPLRMLRLVNGRTCERCCTGRVHLVSENYGVFFCFHGCIQHTSTKGVAFNNKWSSFLVDQPRIAKAAYSSSAYIWIRPYTDAANERVGPLVSMVEIERIMQGDGSVENLLKEKDAVDPHTDAISDIIKVFKDTAEAADRRILERKRKKIKASVDANDRRKTKVLSMIDTLHVELEGVPWKDVALAYHWRKSNSKEVPYFECGLTNKLLREYSSAPSKATKKKLKEVSRSLRQSFGMMEKKGFHDFSSLSDVDPVERAVKEYCMEHYPNYKLLQSPRMDDQALERIQRASDSAELLKDVLSLTKENLVTILAPAIVTSTVAIPSENMRKKAISQAKALLAVVLGGAAQNFWTHSNRSPPMTPIQLYSVITKKFPRLFQNTLDFFDAPETLAWKEEHAREASTERLEYLVNRVWNGPLALPRLLLERDYKAVLNILWERRASF